ncbi:MAG: hypothetical protein ACREOF_02515, partial [Gemmatimonadales bacterium]
ADTVLDVAPARRAITVGGTITPVGSVEVTMGGLPQEDGVLTTPPEVPPPDPDGAERWAERWAAVRFEEKRRRNFAEADRIRDLLRKHGFEVRDAKDGSIQLTRAG